MWQQLSKNYAEPSVAMQAADGPDSDELLFDSCASDHMIANPALLTGLYDVKPEQFGVGNGATVVARQRGTLSFDAILSSENESIEVIHRVIIPDVLYVPDLKANLISRTAVCQEADVEVRERGHKFVVLRDMMMEFRGIHKGGVYVIKYKQNTYETSLTVSTKKDIDAGRLCNIRLGHAGTKRI